MSNLPTSFVVMIAAGEEVDFAKMKPACLIGFFAWYDRVFSRILLRCGGVICFFVESIWMEDSELHYPCIFALLEDLFHDVVSSSMIVNRLWASKSCPGHRKCWHTSRLLAFVTSNLCLLTLMFIGHSLFPTYWILQRMHSSR